MIQTFMYQWNLFSIITSYEVYLGDIIYFRLAPHISSTWIVYYELHVPILSS